VESLPANDGGERLTAGGNLQKETAEVAYVGSLTTPGYLETVQLETRGGSSSASWSEVGRKISP